MQCLTNKLKLAGSASLCTNVVEQRARLVNLVANHDKAKLKDAKQAVEDKQKGENKHGAQCRAAGNAPKLAASRSVAIFIASGSASQLDLIKEDHFDLGASICMPVCVACDSFRFSLGAVL